jgi:hypothetical protein
MNKNNAVSALSFCGIRFVAVRLVTREVRVRSEREREQQGKDGGFAKAQSLWSRIISARLSNNT